MEGTVTKNNKTKQNRNLKKQNQTHKTSHLSQKKRYEKTKMEKVEKSNLTDCGILKIICKQ